MYPPLKRIFYRAAVFIALFLACFCLSWRSGLFRSESGRYPDEGMHYVTGLFVQDFLTRGGWSNPMHFARQYYLHLPKVALGQWPPGFSLMQAAWALVFGVSRVSMLMGMIVLTAWLAFVVYRAGTKYFGPLWGVLGAVLLIAAPLTQEQTGMVMAEIPLAAASFLAMSAWIRFLESESTRDALQFGLWTSAAIMIKGDGWVIAFAAPAILMYARKLRLLLNSRLWLAALLAGAISVPYTLITMRIVAQGWDTRIFPGWAYEWASLEKHAGFIVHLLGLPLTLIAAAGAAAAIFRWPPGSGNDLFRGAIVIYGIVIVLFHVAVPSSIEPRKIYQIMPVMCLLVLAGLDVMAQPFRGIPAQFSASRPVLAITAGLIFLFTGFSLLPMYVPGFGPVVEDLIVRPESRGTAILISSNPQWTDSEAGLIAEWAERRRNDGTFLIRATKLLSHPVADSPGPSQFEPDFTTPDAVLSALSSIPVSFVILHTTEAPISYPHHALLKRALENDKDEWEPIYHTTRYLGGLRQTHEIEVYRFRKSVAGTPVHYSVDLTNKLGAYAGVE